MELLVDFRTLRAQRGREEQQKDTGQKYSGE
jgi:hypothetical protein